MVGAIIMFEPATIAAELSPEETELQASCKEVMDAEQAVRIVTLIAPG